MQRGATPDAPAQSWVDLMPPVTRPWLRLMRADRPIGTWLLLIPCWWGLALAEISGGTPQTDLLTLVIYGCLFAIGAFVMRGAGCAWNDIADRDIDAKVARTATRPLPSGQIKVWQALFFTTALCFIGFGILLSFNLPTILTGIASLALVAIYPFMKRITWWPQAWLGVTFNWGIPVGWMAVMGGYGLPPFLLHLAGIAWTLGYDTIYAHQDKEDDALIGVKSTARRFGQNSAKWIAGFYTATVLFALAAGKAAGAGVWFYPFLAGFAAHLAWQVHRLDTEDGGRCLALFKSNRDAGFLLLAALVAGTF